jgi:hypothetical protein
MTVQFIHKKAKRTGVVIQELKKFYLVKVDEVGEIVVKKKLCKIVED